MTTTMITAEAITKAIKNVWSFVGGGEAVGWGNVGMVDGIIWASAKLANVLNIARNTRKHPIIIKNIFDFLRICYLFLFGKIKGCCLTQKFYFSLAGRKSVSGNFYINTLIVQVKIECNT